MNAWTDADGLLLEATAVQLRKAGNLVQAVAIERAAAELARLRAAQADGGEVVACGGCGNSNPDDRCVGCMHEFYTTPQPTPVQGVVTDAVRALPGDLQWKLDNLRPGSCGIASLTAEEWDYVRAALAAEQAKVPDGWVVVPVEPTNEMVAAVFPLHWRFSPGWEFREHYRAALAAAPSPKVEG